MSWAMLPSTNLQYSQPSSVPLLDTLLLEPVAAAAEQGYASLELEKVKCPVHPFAQVKSSTAEQGTWVVGLTCCSLPQVFTCWHP